MPVEKISDHPAVHVPTAGREREEFIAMLKAIRCEGVPKVTQMMQLLEGEAMNAKRDTARVAAQRAHLRHTFEASQLLYEIEQGSETDPSRRPTIQILVAAPTGDRPPTGDELRSILDEVSDSIRAESPKKLAADL